MEWLDVVDENGNPTGEVISRDEAHQKGRRHRTSHVWLVRMRENKLQLLLQKRSDNKDSYPGCYDISSAGHIPAGEDFVTSAIRELREELGITVRPQELFPCGTRIIQYEERFHGRLFRDNQVSRIYLIWRDQEEFKVQSEEIAYVKWVDFDQCLTDVLNNSIPHCIAEEELLMVKEGAENSRIITAAVEYIRILFQSNAGGHDAEHTLRVYLNTQWLADYEPGCNRQLALLAALLHDVDDHKLFSTDRNENARKFMESHNISADNIETICKIINSVSFSQNQGKRPETIEAKIVQDADRLDAMGAIGIARTFAYGGEHGRPMQESIRHFNDKLLKLKDLMNTEAGKRIAAERHAFLLTFLERYDAEISCTDFAEF